MKGGNRNVTDQTSNKENRSRRASKSHKSDQGADRSLHASPARSKSAPPKHRKRKTTAANDTSQELATPAKTAKRTRASAAKQAQSANRRDSKAPASAPAPSAAARTSTTLNEGDCDDYSEDEGDCPDLEHEIEEEESVDKQVDQSPASKAKNKPAGGGKKKKASSQGLIAGGDAVPVNEGGSLNLPGAPKPKTVGAVLWKLWDKSSPPSAQPSSDEPHPEPNQFVGQPGPTMVVSPDTVDRINATVPFLDIIHNRRNGETPMDIIVTQSNLYGPENHAAIQARRNQKQVNNTGATTTTSSAAFSPAAPSVAGGPSPPTSHSSPHPWVPITYTEICHFIAIVILMGLVQKSNIEDYWTTNSFTATPGIASIMPRHRFMDIFFNLHVSDNNAPLPDTATAHDKKTRKLAPFLEACNVAFQKAYVGGEQVSVDEVMVKFTGHTAMKQYIPAKPVKHGLKFWAIADAKSGYLLRARLYSGKDDDRDEFGIGVGGSIVCLLLTAAGYIGSYRTVFTDNFFSSVSLAVVLLSLGIHMVGTMRTNRRGFPTDALSMSDSASTKGDLKVAEANFSFKDKIHRVLTMSWFDKKQVSFISTKHGALDTSTVQRKEAHSNVKVDVPSHAAIKDYTLFMGGVDRADRKRGQDARHFQTRKWWKAGFFFLLEQAIANASIIFNEIQTDPNKRLSVRDYKLRLVDGLLCLNDETVHGGGYHLQNAKPQHVNSLPSASKDQQHQRWHAARIHPLRDSDHAALVHMIDMRLVPGHHALVPVHNDDGERSRGDCWGCRHIGGNMEAVEICAEYFGIDHTKRNSHRVQDKCNVCGEFFCARCHFLFHSFPCELMPVAAASQDK